MADGLYRASFSLPSDQAVILNNIAKRIGCSQSAIISVLLERVLPHLSVALQVDTSSTRVPRRMRGESAEEIRSLISDAMEDAVHQADLFS